MSVLMRRPSLLIVVANDDLFYSILRYLPPRTLVRFQSTCKRWRYLITGHHLRRSHALLNCRSHLAPSFLLRPNKDGFFYFNPFKGIFRPYPFTSFSNPRIINSCGGLLVLEFKIAPSHQRQYCIYNPCTRDSRNIFLGDDRVIAGLCIAFNPGRHYKVICISRHVRSANEYCIEVYDSENCRWSPSRITFTDAQSGHFFDGLYCNNTIYWYRKSYCFNINSGAFGAPPPLIEDVLGNTGLTKSYMIESHGNLHRISLVWGKLRVSLEIQVLATESLRWQVMDWGALSDVIGMEYPQIWFPQSVSLLSIAREDRTTTLYFLVADRLIFYRFPDGSYGHLDHQSIEQFLKNLRQGYQESLTPV